uniref:Uncharacterized protein LOC103956746 n=1 Tax=Rhizophora mucronata TaxID=61149 RepID=A0A2P2IU27_RHIMU
MGSKWRKAKLMLGLNTCLYAPPALDEDESSSHSVARFSESVSLSPRGPSTPTPSSSGLRLSKSGHKSYSKVVSFPLYGFFIFLFFMPVRIDVYVLVMLFLIV